MNKLISSNVDKKFLIVLFDNLVDEVRNKCKKRQNDAIDLGKKNIQILSIEKIIESKL